MLDNRPGGRLGGGRGSEAATRLLLACGLTPVRFAAGEAIRKGGAEGGEGAALLPLPCLERRADGRRRRPHGTAGH